MGPPLGDNLPLAAQRWSGRGRHLPCIATLVWFRPWPVWAEDGERRRGHVRGSAPFCGTASSFAARSCWMHFAVTRSANRYSGSGGRAHHVPRPSSERNL